MIFRQNRWFLKGAAQKANIGAELSRLKLEEAGERIGNYRLLEQIGEGGVGGVWVAEQERPRGGAWR